MKLRILAFLLALSLLAGCGAEDDPWDLREVSQVLGLDLTGAAVLEASDTHGGFHGDGTSSLKLQFPEAPQLEEGWLPLPMSETVTALCYGISTEAGQIGPYIPDGQIPPVEKGYYLFLDRHTGQREHPDILTRHSFNFTLAVYDSNTNILYYVTQDT